MNYLKIGGIVGAGGIGALGAGMLVSDALNNGLAWVFGLALLIFVTAGAIALIARAIK